MVVQRPVFFLAAGYFFGKFCSSHRERSQYLDRPQGARSLENSTFGLQRGESKKFCTHRPGRLIEGRHTMQMVTSQHFFLSQRSALSGKQYKMSNILLMYRNSNVIGSNT